MLRRKLLQLLNLRISQLFKSGERGSETADQFLSLASTYCQLLAQALDTYDLAYGHDVRLDYIDRGDVKMELGATADTALRVATIHNKQEKAIEFMTYFHKN